jgi:hypothetical protein
MRNITNYIYNQREEVPQADLVVASRTSLRMVCFKTETYQYTPPGDQVEFIAVS